MNNNEFTIAVILGGNSPERPVSKQSGKSLYKAVKNLNYNVKIVDPAYGINQPKNNEEYFSDCDCGVLSNENYINAINSNLFDDVDLALIALHGKWGEDGIIQALFELKDIKYTGTGVLGSSLSMDKSKSKAMFNHFGVSTPNWFNVKRNEKLNDINKKIKEVIKYPCIIKPNDQGSTIGLTKCTSEAELEEALNLAFQFTKNVLVEEFIDGREITAGIIGNRTLPLLEIIPKHEL